MPKRIYFHVDEGSMPLELWDNIKNINNIDSANSYERTEELIRRGAENIHTMSMAHLSFDLIDLGYEIYLRYKTMEYKVYPGMSLPPTGKELRKAHNIFKLFRAHCFDYVLGINEVIGYYTYGDQNNAKNVKLAFERKGYSCPDFGTDSKDFFLYTLPNSKYVTHCDATLDDNKRLAQLFKTHQGYQELIIPTDEVPTDGIDNTVIAPVYKAGDTITGDGVNFTIDRIDYEQQKYFDSIGGFVRFSDQDKWTVRVEPKFKIGDKVKQVGEYGGSGYRVDGLIDDHKGFRYVLKWWEDGRECSMEVPVEKQDDYYIVVKPKFKVGNVITDGTYTGDVAAVYDDSYALKDCIKNETNEKFGCCLLAMNEQEKWELVKKPMALREAIAHAKEIAKTCDDTVCAKDHKNLAEWLEELRAYRFRYGPIIGLYDIDEEYVSSEEPF